MSSSAFPVDARVDVLHEDNHLLVVSKPAGMLVQGDASGRASLVDWAKLYRKSREAKKGDAYVGLVHRLDEAVSGVVVLAKTSKSASRLSEQFRKRTVEKKYWAVAECRHALPPSGEEYEWSDVIVRDDPRPLPRAEDRRRQSAVTRARCLERSGDLALLELKPRTGRKHQLRIQTGEHVGPIVGDTRYGSKRSFAPGIALHARALSFDHPITKAVMTFEADPPAEWSVFPFKTL